MIDSEFHTVCAIVVTFHPDESVLRVLLNALVKQVGAVVVVDNTPAGSSAGHAISGVDAVLGQGRNLGLAVAQNEGIRWAREHGFRHVLLLDQDSEPGEGMVAALLDALFRLSASGAVAAVGPRFHDLHEEKDAPFVRLGFFLNKKVYCEYQDQTVRSDFLISSGALIPIEVIDHVGAMCAGLFIDNVDLEWGFRARSLGYELHGVCAAQMNHRIGDSRHSVMWGLGRVAVHSPVRLYYMMRNRILLYRMPHTPIAWVTQDLPRVVAKLFLFGALIGPRLRNVRYMLRGLWDGLCGRDGTCPITHR